ncbi:hypothetical protein ACFIQF_12930 [Comamonas sp. J-3]|uniref:hypothetical protein n=1 Tax=Comamonas trifloxystrobinivorans TaxID=3350256 RepID=UPI00372B9269
MNDYSYPLGISSGVAIVEPRPKPVSDLASRFFNWTTAEFDQIQSVPTSAVSASPDIQRIKRQIQSRKIELRREAEDELKALLSRLQKEAKALKDGAVGQLLKGAVSKHGGLSAANESIARLREIESLEQLVVAALEALPEEIEACESFDSGLYSLCDSMANAVLLGKARYLDNQRNEGGA